MMTNVQLTGVKVTRVTAHHYPRSPKTGSEFFSLVADTDVGGLTLLLTREQMDLICVRMGQALVDSDPKAPALMERDPTGPVSVHSCGDPACGAPEEQCISRTVSSGCPALETWHAIDCKTGAILLSVNATSYDEAATQASRHKVGAVYEMCRASDIDQ